MQRRFSKVAIVSAAFVVVVGLAIVIRGDEALRLRNGVPLDWSHSHLIFSNPGSFAQAVRNGSVAHWYKIMNDPRYQMQQLRQNARAAQRNVAALKPTPAKSTPPKPAPPKSTPLVKDWNFSLQTAAVNGGVAWYRYPAKYSFNETGASCTGDFVIYGLFTAGSSTQANLVGVNNLYVGAAGGGGCGSITNNGGAGSAPTPQVKWAFNVSTGNIIGTSVVLNLAGTKVAYVVNSDPPVLQVLTLGTGGGTVTAPASTFGACNTTGPSLCTVTLSSSTSDLISAPYVDYANDVGYVGDDTGHLYKVTNLFSVNGTAPALAGGSWPVTAGSSPLGAPVYDGATGTVFVNSENGDLYGFTSSGTAITGSPLALATNNVVSDGIVEAAPIVDSSNHVLYEFYGDNAAGTAAEAAQVVFTGTPQFATSTTSALTTAGTNKADFLTTSPIYIITEGAFSHGYYTNGPSTTSWLYACGTNALNTGSNAVGVTLQQFGFNASGILQAPTKVATPNTTLTQSGIYLGGASGAPCSPLTEFYNTNGTPVDYLFLTLPGVYPDNVLSYTLPGGVSGGATSTGALASAGWGASGIIVDGADPTSNASSLYFTSQFTNVSITACTTSSSASPANTGIGSVGEAVCAFKLTQSGLE